MKRRQMSFGWLSLFALMGVGALAAPGCAQAVESQPPAVQAISEKPSPTSTAWLMLVEEARGLAAGPYSTAPGPLADELGKLDYDGHRDIRCLPEDFLWYGTEAPFRLQFRHPGWLFKESVQLGVVDPKNHQPQDLAFDQGRFTYGPIALSEIDPGALPADLGYAGIGLHQVGYEENAAGENVETFNEFMSIQGASYFRAIGFGQHWGSSARGIAINTGLNQPEEFPRWIKLWVQQPLPGEDTLTLYGLLDGPSVSGAYRFVVRPGETLSMDVKAQLFFRQKVDKLGLSPMTGMFLFGEATPARFGDYRPEVHDADGLLMHHADGELDWRPLHNPEHTRVSRFQMTNPAGFGLVQRDRNFNHYEDLETEMQIRPSIWVTPGNYLHAGPRQTIDSNNPSPQPGWGEGWVELFEIASDDEGIDNIGAYWVPADEAWNTPGGTIALDYQLDFTQAPRPAKRTAIPWVATRTMFSQGQGDDNDKSLVRTSVSNSDGRPVARFIIDTAPDTALPSGTIVRSDVTVTHGELVGDPVIQYNKFNHAYRLFFDVIADGGKPVELRATLRGATALDREKEKHPEGTFDDVVDPDTGPPLSETWLYRWDLP